MKSGKKDEPKVVDVLLVHQGRVSFYVVGTEGIILNTFSNKAKHELLAPGMKMNAATKASRPKHEVLEEFRSSAHQLKEGPTLLAIQSGAFKKAMSSAALDLPDVQKSKIGRLTYVEGQYIHIYGTPKLMMSMVRSADMNRTPDVRTRCIVPKWCAKISITYVTPLLKEQSVINLLAAAGLFIGVGDWRPEKGSANYGTFRMAQPNDKELAEILKQGRKQQVAGMAKADPYNAETAELLTWWTAEIKRRGFGKQTGKSEVAHGRPNGKPMSVEIGEEA